MKIYKLFTCLAGIILLSATSCKQNIPSEPPNIVWITSEDNSVHYMKLFHEQGVETPNIESLAKNGITFTRAFSNAPVCSAARSAIISGCYGPRIGANFHRKIEIVPMPDSLDMFPAYLRRAGYYTTNNNKEDYNLIKGSDVWDESSAKATWKNRNDNQPFFHVFNITTTHESRLHFTREQMDTTPVITTLDPSVIFPNHPDTELFTYTNAYYRDKIREMDGQVGEVVRELEEEGLLESTFIFYYGDHGGVLPGSKGYLYETGLHVPMVVHIPEKYRHLVEHKPGGKAEGFVSFTDLAPTVMQLAGVDIPKGMDGKPFLGKGIKAKESESRDETFGYADRFDEKYDMVRSFRKGNYKYIRSYMPFNFDGLMNNYRYRQLAYQEWDSLFKSDELNDLQSKFFQPRRPELLFDLEADPFETNDLSQNPDFREKLLEMRNGLDNWVKGMPDLSFYPEHYLIREAFDQPVSFGREHSEDIRSYIDIANLALQKPDDVKDEIVAILNSEDPWKRYWGLIVCSSFAKVEFEWVGMAYFLSLNDPELLNRVRAAEYLAITGENDPSEVMTKALYESRDDTEALLILNSIVLMQDGAHHYSFSIDPEKMDPSVLNSKLIAGRMEYLNYGQ